MAEEEEKKAEEQAEGEAPEGVAAESAADDEQAAGSDEHAAAEAEAPAEAEAEADAAAEPEATDDDGDDAAAAAPAAAEPSDDEEAPAELTPKQRRKLARSTHAGEAGPELSTEERQERRASERTRKAESRRRYRKGRGAARAKAAGKGSGTGTPPAAREPGKPKVRQGVVVSDRMDKTITVRVESARRHPSYEKVIRTSKMYHAHDERNEAGAGDTVRLVETRPMSKTKRWRLTEILERAT
jgi:small subunit ribosomal protein S17